MAIGNEKQKENDLDKEKYKNLEKKKKISDFEVGDTNRRSVKNQKKGGGEKDLNKERCVENEKGEKRSMDSSEKQMKNLEQEKKIAMKMGVKEKKLLSDNSNNNNNNENNSLENRKKFIIDQKKILSIILDKKEKRLLVGNLKKSEEIPDNNLEKDNNKDVTVFHPTPNDEIEEVEVLLDLKSEDYCLIQSLDENPEEKTQNNKRVLKKKKKKVLGMFDSLEGRKKSKDVLDSQCSKAADVAVNSLLPSSLSLLPTSSPSPEGQNQQMCGNYSLNHLKLVKKNG
jgi:hypothetical protein